MAIVKSPFTLITDDGRRIEFAAGEQDIPSELADHWYVQAHCEPATGVYDAPEQPAEGVPADDPAAEPEKRGPGRPKKS